MFCKNCGKEIDDNAYICIHCGALTKEDDSIENDPSNGMATAGFVFSFFFPFLGLIFGIVGLNNANNLPEKKGKSLAVAAITISIIGLCVSLGILF